VLLLRRRRVFPVLQESLVGLACCRGFARSVAFTKREDDLIFLNRSCRLCDFLLRDPD